MSKTDSSLRMLANLSQSKDTQGSNRGINTQT